MEQELPFKNEKEATLDVECLSCGTKKTLTGQESIDEWTAHLKQHDEVGSTLDERGKRYGRWKDNAEVSQAIKRSIRTQQGYASLPEPSKEALSMICQKIARIINGDPTYQDNWIDIAGYATLEVQRLQGQ